MEYFTLNNGVKIPALGLGTNTIGKENRNYWGSLNGDYRPIFTAAQMGYRMFDNARGYRNEGGIGNTLYETGIPREDLFIISKLPGNPENTANEAVIRKTFEDSLRLLRVDYIDLYMIHHPWRDNDGMAATYKVLEKLQEEGLCRAIGVSNFTVDMMEMLSAKCNVAPAVNEYQCNVYDWNDELTEYCHAHGIQPIGWGPVLGLMNFPQNAPWTFAPDQLKMLVQRSQGKSAIQEINRLAGYRAALDEMGEKYGKTYTQIQLRYNYQAGIVSIPKSFSVTHQKENLESMDFELSAEDFRYLHDKARGIGEVTGPLHAVTHKDAELAGDI
ncbi:MAG: aldo/keto reductase family protein [Oscillospiraceae bacterium]